mgnify:CR=1 FL=1
MPEIMPSNRLNLALTLKQGVRYQFGLVAGSDVPRDAAVSLTQAYGPLYKVYVGPEIRRAQMEQQKTELERKYNLKALILKYIP